MKNNMVFAIYADGKFIAWAYGMFMQLVNKPKIYGYSKYQLDTVKRNFISKIKRINKKSELDFNNHIASSFINNGQNKDKNILSQYSKFELRMYKTDYEVENWEDDINRDTPDFIYKYE